MVTSSFSGADVAQVRALAARMRLQSSKLREIVASSSTALLMAEWTGNDIDAIRDRWLRTSKPTLASLADRFHELGVSLDLQADQQEQASGATGVGGSLPGPGAFGWPGAWVGGFPPWFGAVPGFFDDLIIDGGDWISKQVDWAQLAVQYLTDKKFDAWETIPGGSYLSSALKGIGLGDAGARLAQAIQGGDLSGGMLAAADGASTFVPTPISLLYGGLKDQIAFYIPLEKSAQDDHFAWMEERGYSPAAIAERYSGLQGFIDLGNDNVERKAPWANDIADSLLRVPGEWLLSVGIKLY